MKIGGLDINTQAIGRGIYDMICDKGEEAIVAFGMIPKWASDVCEKELRAKIYREAAKQVGCTEQEMALLADEDMVARLVKPIMHQICVDIYGAASEAGKMIV